MAFDGQQQRKALTAVERSVQALAAGRPDDARRAAATAASLDQVGAFHGLVDAVEVAAIDLDRSGVVGDAAWDLVADAVGPGPVAAAVEEARGRVR